MSLFPTVLSFPLLPLLSHAPPLLCWCGRKCKERPMELVFVIDSSESVGPGNFLIIKDFVNAVVDKVTVGDNATRVGLVLYSLEVRLEFGLNRYRTQHEIGQAINRMPYLGEGTYTGTAIRKAVQEGFRGARPSVKRVAIVITDGQTDKREPIKLDMAVREAHAGMVISLAVIGGPPQCRRIWYFTQADWQGLQAAIKLLDWSPISTFFDINSSWEFFQINLLSRVRRFIPSRLQLSFPSLPPMVH
uniref:VWFA domain-containing protein n=1 Tax=Eptatretus burgeri TaxID=7764 RepID=A0A8C4X246_EPTBU